MNKYHQTFQCVLLSDLERCYWLIFMDENMQFRKYRQTAPAFHL